jgi:hypothetical protein
MKMFDSLQRQVIFFLTVLSILFLLPIQLPVQWEQGAVSRGRGYKKEGHAAYCLPPSTAEFKNNGNIFPPPIRLLGVVLN